MVIVSTSLFIPLGHLNFAWGMPISLATSCKKQHPAAATNVTFWPAHKSLLKDLLTPQWHLINPSSAYFLADQLPACSRAASLPVSEGFVLIFSSHLAQCSLSFWGAFHRAPLVMGPSCASVYTVHILVLYPLTYPSLAQGPIDLGLMHTDWCRSMCLQGSKIAFAVLTLGRAATGRRKSQSWLMGRESFLPLQPQKASSAQSDLLRKGEHWVSFLVLGIHSDN